MDREAPLTVPSAVYLKDLWPGGPEAWNALAKNQKGLARRACRCLAEKGLIAFRSGDAGPSQQLAGCCTGSPWTWPAGSKDLLHVRPAMESLAKRLLAPPMVEGKELYYILYYTILYYTILYYTILYYTGLYCTILYYTILYYTILYCTVLGLLYFWLS